MTIKEKLEKMLHDRIMWPEEIKAVMDQFMVLEQNVAIRWDSPTEGYPSELIAALWMCLRMEAIDYLKKNAPMSIAITALEA